MNRSDDILHVELLDESRWFSASELCEVCQAQLDTLAEMVEWGMLEVQGSAPSDWRFPAHSVRRARTAMRLLGDLGVNLAGAAVIIDLIDERDRLLRELEQLEALRRDRPGSD